MFCLVVFLIFLLLPVKVVVTVQVTLSAQRGFIYPACRYGVTSQVALVWLVGVRQVASRSSRLAGLAV